MKLASHNSFSYLPVRKWWMKLFAWAARCQQETITMQYLKGARMFDLRLRFDESKGYFSRPYICHGLIEYKTAWSEIYDILDMLNERGDCYLRMVLETKKHDIGQEENFRLWCKCFQAQYKNIVFLGGNNRTDWLAKNPIYDFGNPMEDIDHQYASATSRFMKGPFWLRYLDDLYPKGYAKRYNFINRTIGTRHAWLMLDFVDIQ